MARSADEIRTEMLTIAHGTGKKAAELSQGQKGAIVGYLSRAVGGDNNRHIVLSWLFRGGIKHAISSKELTSGEWYALHKWLDMYQNEDGWHTQPAFEIEAARVVVQAVKAKAAARFGVDPDGLVAEAASLPGHKVITDIGDDH